MYKMSVSYQIESLKTVIENHEKVIKKLKKIENRKNNTNNKKSIERTRNNKN